MRIHSVVIDNFRAIEHLELNDLPQTGVIVIHGCNEAGKSTILDAIDLVLRERHTAGGRKISVFAPAGRDEGPEVTLTATVGETTFTIRKRWIKRKLAELTVTAPTRRNYTGREADDELERILREHMDTYLAQTLFLRQGELEPGIAAAGIPSITRALDAQSGGGDQGEEDTELSAAIEAEYAKYWTGATPPKEKAPYKALFTAVDTARDDLAQAEARVQDLSRFVDEVARREDEMARAEEELPEAREELAEREAEFAAAAKLRETADAAEQSRVQAEAALERALKDREDRAAKVQRVEQLRAEEDELRVALDPAREARDAEQVKISELTKAVEDAKTHVAEARTGVTRAEYVREHVRAAARARAVADQLERIAAAEKSYEQLLNTAPQREVSDKDVRAIEQALSELTLQRRLRDAASAKLDITAAGERITVDGEAREVDGTESVAVFDGTELILGEFTVVYRAAQGTTDPNAAVDQAQRELDSALARTGCDTLEQAREARDAYAAHAAELKAARTRRDDALAGADAGELRAEAQRLANRLEELDEALGEAPAEDVTETDADADLKRAQQALKQAERDVDTAEAALKPYAERTAAQALTVAETRLEGKEAEAAAAAAELRAAEEQAPAEQLDQAVTDARADAEDAAATARTVQQQLAEADPELASQLLDGATARLSNLEQRRADAHNRITELKGHIQLATGAAEHADQAAAVLEKAESDLARAQRRAEAVKLLRTTMHAHRDAARARYTAPFTEAIRNRARVLFGPSVDFNLGDDLTVSDRTVDGVTVPLTELSGGTKEQLALLTRFAIADLVTEGGSTTPVPVVVDDALGATDPDRLIRMNSLFNQVGKNSQVLVLTCFPQRFDRVAAAKTIDIDDAKRKAEQ